MRFPAILMAFSMLACACGQDVPSGIPPGDWWCAMKEGRSGWATLTFGPITAVYEGARVGGHGCGGNHSVVEIERGHSSKCLCGRSTETTDVAIKVRFRGHTFEVLEPGTAIMVDGERHAVDPVSRMVIRFPANGKAVVSKEAGN